MRRRGAAPPKAIKIKPVKLDTAGLIDAYAWLALDRLQGLRMALEWYEHNEMALMLGHPLTDAQRKAYDRAAKAKNLGFGAQGYEERDAAWRTALRQLEIIWPNLPKVEDAVTAAATPSRRAKAVVDTLAMLNTVFAGWGTRYTVTCGERKTVATTETASGFEIAIPPEDLAAVAAKPLSALQYEAVALAKELSARTVDGVTRLDGALFFDNLPKMLEDVAAWATEDPKRIKPVTGIAKVKAAGIQTPRTTAAVPITKFSKDAVIHHTASFNVNYYKGARVDQAQAIQDGMTVADYYVAHKAAKQANWHVNDSPGSFLGLAVKAGLITVDPVN